MADLTIEDLRDWLEGRPDVVRELAVRFPPGCVVTSKEGFPLLVPAPGVEGQIFSYYESGMVSVVAPMAETLTSPITGATVEKGAMIKGDCHPEALDVVRYGPFSPDDVRAALAEH